MHVDARYRVTRRLDLARCKLIKWNQMEVSDIVRWIEGVEMDITNF